jgi:hypothetical protein
MTAISNVLASPWVMAPDLHAPGVIQTLKQKIVVKPTNARFKDSFGDQLSNISNRSRWVLIGSANTLWHDKIRPFIDELLRENGAEILKGWSVGDPATIRHCWMVGYNKDFSHPTVVICCNIKGILKRSMKVIIEDGQLKREGFELKGLLTRDLTLTQGRGVRLASAFEVENTPRGLCGAGITIDGSSRHATIGGVIIIDGKYFGLTVAHAFVDRNTSSEQWEVPETDMQFLDSDWANQSSSDDDSGSCEIRETGMERDYSTVPWKNGENRKTANANHG